MSRDGHLLPENDPQLGLDLVGDRIRTRLLLRVGHTRARRRPANTKSQRSGPCLRPTDGTRDGFRNRLEGFLFEFERVIVTAVIVARRVTSAMLPMTAPGFALPLYFRAFSRARYLILLSTIYLWIRS